MKLNGQHQIAQAQAVQGSDAGSPSSTGPARVYEAMIKAAQREDLPSFKQQLSSNLRSLLGGDAGIREFMLGFQGVEYADPRGFDVRSFATPSLGTPVGPGPKPVPEEGDRVLMSSIPHPETIKHYERVLGAGTPELAEMTAELQRPESFVFQRGAWRLDYEP